MNRVAIVADSSACLPQPLIEQHRIGTVPLAVLVGGSVYRDGEISREAFYQRLREGEHATTAAPAPGEFLAAFRRAREEGAKSVLCLTLSSRYSGTYSSARKAAELAGSELPGLPVRALDTGGIASAHGFAVLAAARAAAAGASLEACAAEAERAAAGAQLIGMLDTTRHLARSGRIPLALHWAASLLRIKPLIVARDGRAHAFGRVRTAERGIERMVAYVRKKRLPGLPLRVAIMHADAPARAENLADRVRRVLSPDDILLTEFTPAMAVHTGPGFLGLAWQVAEAVAETGPARARRSPRLLRDLSVLEAALGRLPEPMPQPAFVILSGLPGSGKSHLARDLAACFPLAIVESDASRKALVKSPNYSQQESGRLFSACHALLEDLLARSIPCLLDATNLKEAHRRPLYAIAERTGARLVVVEVRADEEVVSARLGARSTNRDPNDRSDATADVYQMMRDEAEPIARPHLVVDSSGDTRAAVEEIVRRLQEDLVCG